jgi:hypothetical protein
MASTSETGHDVNIQQFKLIIDRCTEFTTNYQPSNNLLTIISMTSKWTEVGTAHNTYLEKLMDTKDPINDREAFFENLKGIVTRVNNIFGSTEAKASVKRDIKGYVKKILGSNVKIPMMEGDIPDPKYVSNSQQSFVKKIYNFRQMIFILKNNSFYAPNETILKIVSLQSLLADLESKNLSVEEILGHAIHYRELRDHGLYDIDKGVIDIALACKKYVKGLYGATSTEAKSVTSIKLRRFKKLKPVPVS